MSCLSVIIERISKSLDVIAERIGGIAVDVSRYGTPITATVSDIGKHLSVSCGIVCEVGDLHILKVSPEEVQWITPDEGIVYMVESDTNWNILVN